MTASPFVSIVMPSYMQARFIGRSIDSVLGQSHANLELIVQDGGSDDGTIEILREKASRDPRLKWESAPDEGPADAINKALVRSRGTIIGWLNSDDLYTPGAVSRAVDALDDPLLLMVYGHGEHVDEEDEKLSAYPTRRPDAGIDAFHTGCFICQPTAFFKRTMYSLLGPLEQSLKTSFDFEYWLRAFSNFPDRIGFVDKVQARSRLHDACITRNERGTVAAEGVELTDRYLGDAKMHWVSTHLQEIVTMHQQDNSMDDVFSMIDRFLSEISHAYDARVIEEMRSQARLMLDAGTGRKGA